MSKSCWTDRKVSRLGFGGINLLVVREPMQVVQSYGGWSLEQRLVRTWECFRQSAACARRGARPWPRGRRARQGTPPQGLRSSRGATWPHCRTAPWGSLPRQMSTAGKAYTRPWLWRGPIGTHLIRFNNNIYLHPERKELSIFLTFDQLWAARRQRDVYR